MAGNLLHFAHKEAIIKIRKGAALQGRPLLWTGNACGASVPHF